MECSPTEGAFSINYSILPVNQVRRPFKIRNGTFGNAFCMNYIIDGIPRGLLKERALVFDYF